MIYKRECPLLKHTKQKHEEKVDFSLASNLLSILLLKIKRDFSF